MVGGPNASFIVRNSKSHYNGDGMNKEPKHPRIAGLDTKAKNKNQENALVFNKDGPTPDT